MLHHWKAPFIDLAADSLIQTTRNALTLWWVFWVPWLAGAVLVVAEKMVRLNVTGVPAQGVPHWLDSIVWAPFAAWMVIAALRCLTQDQTPSWRYVPHFGTAFGLVALLHMVDGVGRYALPLIENAAYQTYLMSLTTGASYQPISEAQIRTGVLLHFAGAVLVVTISSVVALVTTPLIWSWVVAGRQFLTIYFRSVRLTWFRALLFFMIFEIAYRQLAIAYGWLAFYFDPISPATKLMAWRAHVLPEFLVELLWMPFFFVVHVTSVSALIVFCRWVEAARLSEPALPCHRVKT